MGNKSQFFLIMKMTCLCYLASLLKISISVSLTFNSENRKWTILSQGYEEMKKSRLDFLKEFDLK